MTGEDDDRMTGEGEPIRPVYATEAEDEPLGILETYLLLEVTAGSARTRDRRLDARHQEEDYGPAIRPVVLLGVLAAENEDEAVKIAMSETSRLGLFGVVPVTLIDFAVNVQRSRQARGRMLRLNPGD